MAKDKHIPSTFTNMVIVMTFVALISALALSFTFSATKARRDQVKLKKTLKALENVLPEFDNDPASEKYTISSTPGLEYYPAKQNGQLVGVAVKTYSDNGFSDQIWLLVGFDIDKHITNIEVLSQRETPGLGTRMEEAHFKEQFFGKNPQTFRLEVKKRGGDVDALTAATITTRAFCDAVQRAYKGVSSDKAVGGGEK